MIGTVLGELVFGRSWSPCSDFRWIQVRSGVQILEAVDLVGTKTGETVLLVTGETAGRLSMGCPGDWCAVAVLGSAGNNS